MYKKLIAKLIALLCAKISDSTCRKIERTIAFYDVELEALANEKAEALKRLAEAEKDAHKAHRQLLMLRG